MVTAIVLSFLLAAACIVIAVLLLFRGADRALAAATSLAHVGTLPVVASASANPSPKADSVTGPSAPTLSPVAQTRIRLVSNAGRHLGDAEIPAKARRASFTQRVGKARELSNFVASHRDGEVWVYRRVSVERES